jgi:protein O-mannosyl-transferase
MSKNKKSASKRAIKARWGSSISSSLLFRVSAGIVIIVTAAFLVYFPSLSGGFVLDDDLYLTRNNIVKASDGLCRFWCTLEAEDYWPMTYTSFWIDWRLWGMDPTGYHLLNLVLHVVASLLIWLVLRRLSIPGAFWTALIFALHPVNVESVAWISQRKENLAMLFFLLSILWYLKYYMRSRIPLAAKLSLSTAHRPLPTFSSFILHPSSFYLWYWLSLAAFVLAMLGKGSVAVLPVLLLGILWWLRATISISNLLRIAPFFLVAVALTAVNLWTQSQHVDTMHPIPGFAERLLGAGGVVWFYLYKALLPINLVFIYPQWQIQPGNPLWWLPLAAVLAVTAGLWVYRNTWSRPLLFAWGFFCVSLAPALGLTQVGFMKYSLVADHYQHIAVIGVIALASAGFSIWCRQRASGDCPDFRFSENGNVPFTRAVESYGHARQWTYIVIIASVGMLALLTWNQNRLYRGIGTLYEATLKKNSDCWVLHNNLGAMLVQVNRNEEAIEHYKQAIRINPDYVEAYNNLGTALLNAGRPKEAIENFKKAMQIDPNVSVTNNNMSAALVELDQPEEAIKYGRRALELIPVLPETYNNLGNACIELGRPEEAIGHYQHALRLNPNYFTATFNLANALVQTNRPKEAIEYYQKVIDLKPDDFETLNNLGGALLQAGRPLEALDHVNQALRIKPDYSNAYLNLALTYDAMHQSSQAAAAAQRALDFARSQGQTDLAKQIEDWLNSRRKGPGQ